jgi:uncharacterized membrane protein (DUF441 family)
MPGVPQLVALLIVGIAARSNLISIAACILLVLRLSNLNIVFPLLERRGLETGLLFLLLSILVPVANGVVTEKDLIYSMTSMPGILSIIGGALATHMNGEGIKLMQVDPEIIFGLIIGSIFGIVFFHGIPVGPLTAAGISALFLEIFLRNKKL